MFIGIYNTFSCKYMKFIKKYEKTVSKYLSWLEFPIPAFRAFCKTALHMRVYLSAPQAFLCISGISLLSSATRGGIPPSCRVFAFTGSSM